tara:strand:- start:12142 stop:12543 length:402 start_codon:yes stop_codon:yes gene_type:complete
MFRDCGNCDVCCIVPEIEHPDLMKPAHTICPNLDQTKACKKCTIYENRPTATVAGFLDGGCTISHCNIGNLNYIDGAIHDSQLDNGTVTINGTQAEFIDCWSGVAADAQALSPIIDLGGSGIDQDSEYLFQLT